ncbi:FAS1 domain-containing protein precursor [Aspergillus terreus]|nr:FAS1 domain-containing protein precursor [Aspergillus terreus]
MRPILNTVTLGLSFLCATSAAVAWEVPSLNTLRKRLPRALVDTPHLRDHIQLEENRKLQQWLQTQQPPTGNFVPQVVMPGTNDGNDGAGHGTNDDNPVIADVLPRTRGINIFAGLTRDFESVESRLNDAKHNITVLAPRNSAIQGLPRKPWENPDDYAQFGEAAAYEGQDGQDRAKRNLKRFVDAHIVTTSPWAEGEEAETLGGDTLRWTKDGEKIYIQPGNIEVDSVAEKVSNGEVWVLNGVINYR